MDNNHWTNPFNNWISTCSNDGRGSKIFQKLIQINIGRQKQKAFGPPVRMSELSNYSPKKEHINNKICKSTIYTSTLKKSDLINSAIKTKTPNKHDTQFSINLNNTNDKFEDTNFSVQENKYVLLHDLRESLENKSKINNLNIMNNNENEEINIHSLNQTEENKDQKVIYENTRDTKINIKLVIPSTPSTETETNILNDLKKNNDNFTNNDLVNYPSYSVTQNNIRSKRNAPIMGKNALLAKINKQPQESTVIHDLVIEKYNGILNHYLERSYNRRSSRTDSEDIPDDTKNIGDFNIFDIKYYIPAPKIKYSESAKELLRNKKGLSFLMSTDDINVETTVESDLKNESSLHDLTYEHIDEKSSTDISDYDAQKFLKAALGDEFKNLSYESRDNNQKLTCNIKQTKSDVSVDTSDISTLLSKASSVFQTAKQVVKKYSSSHLSPSTKIIEKVDVSEDYDTNLKNYNPKGEALMKQIIIQNEIIFQISKALNFCTNTKEFSASLEQIEAEKILLVAICTKEALNSEISKLEYEDPFNNNTTNLGQMELSHIQFSAKEKQCDDKDKNKRDFSEYFVCVLTCGSTVIASDVAVIDASGNLSINKSFKFSKLRTDFEVSLSIYSMKVRNCIRNYSHESKFHLNKEVKNGCLSPKRILHLSRDSQKFKLTNELTYLRSSSFHLWGKSCIHIQNLTKKGQLKLHNTPLSSTLSENFSIQIKSDVELNNSMKGFLTIGLENGGCPIWNRRWCVLEKCSLKYWNYPSEENAGEPNGLIDLKSCRYNHISHVDRNLCARPRTLYLPVISKNKEEKTYLLSADTSTEMKLWEKELNDVVSSLYNWNCMNREI